MSSLSLLKTTLSLVQLLACAIVFGTCATSRGLEVSAAHFKKMHEKYRNEAVHIDCEMHSLAAVPGKEIKGFVKSTTCPSGFVFTAGIPSSGAGNTAQGANSQYSFRLSRADDSMPWRIDDLTLFAGSQPKRPLKPFCVHIDLITSVLRVPLHELLADDNCRVNAVTSNGPAGEEILQLRIYCDQPLKNNKSITGIEATVDLYSKEHPIISRWEAKFTSGGIPAIEVVNNRFQVIEGIPFLIESKSEVTKRGDHFFASWKFDSLQPTDCSQGQRPFTLSAFGLPEPPGTTVLQKGLPYWAVVTAGGVLLVGIGIYLRNRRIGRKFT
jgi:hypothetical protein